LGNHYLANAKALVFAGLFFSGSEAESWLAKGLHIFSQQFPEQILDDGGHFERSPMYHSIVLGDILDLYYLSGLFGSGLEGWRARFEALALKMLHWLRVLSHPDGNISFFNDAAFDIAPTLALLERYATAVGIAVPSPDLDGATFLQNSGYVRLQRGDAVAILDVGDIGPYYLPGHAHADTLSFELSLGKDRLLVNSGTNCYGQGRDRDWQRSTSAHNTVVVDGENSSVIWGGFRVAQRAHPINVSVRQCSDGSLLVSAAHDGYKRLPGRVVHTRTWCLGNTGIEVSDVLEGHFNSAVARFHLFPGHEIVQLNGLAVRVGQRTVRFETEPTTITLEPSEFYPGFGRRHENKCITVRLLEGKTQTRLVWN
jgi:uncharacterized heparinase superfamily protein